LVIGNCGTTGRCGLLLGGVTPQESVQIILVRINGPGQTGRLTAPGIDPPPQLHLALLTALGDSRDIQELGQIDPQSCPQVSDAER